tara:strand:- start:67 stop:843 length:777 start_codon:yes stop_codon:yes gene_type:complete
MAWPSSKPDSTAFDNANDSIADSRAEIKTMSDAVNDIVDFIDTTGIASGDVLVYDSVGNKLVVGQAGGDITDSDKFVVGQIDSANEGQARIEVTRGSGGTVAFGVEPETASTGRGSEIVIQFNRASAAAGDGAIILKTINLSGTASHTFRQDYVELSARTIVSGELNVNDGTNRGSISSENLSGGSFFVYNDRNQDSNVKLTPTDIQINPAGTLDLTLSTQTSVGSAGAASSLPANPTGYLILKINGTNAVIPYYAQS